MALVNRVDKFSKHLNIVVSESKVVPLAEAGSSQCRALRVLPRVARLGAKREAGEKSEQEAAPETHPLAGFEAYTIRRAFEANKRWATLLIASPSFHALNLQAFR